jgi:CHRD domain
MLRLKHFEATFAAAVVGFLASYACAQEFTADLSGFDEIGSIPTAFPAASTTTSPTGYTGAVLSDGKGTATLHLDQKAGTIAYTLTYSNVGTTPPQTGTVSQAHIHFGKSRDSGGILVFFCTNLQFNGTGPTPQSCPANGGTVTGMWTKDDVQAILGQNVRAGDFDALVDALESNTAYANIHTIPLPGATNTAYPGGEIRGQVHLAKEEKEQHDHRN